MSRGKVVCMCICWTTEADRRDIVAHETPIEEEEICVNAYCSVLYSCAASCILFILQNLGSRHLNLRALRAIRRGMCGMMHCSRRSKKALIWQDNQEGVTLLYVFDFFSVIFFLLLYILLISKCLMGVQNSVRLDRCTLDLFFTDLLFVDSGLFYCTWAWPCKFTSEAWEGWILTATLLSLA